MTVSQITGFLETFAPKSYQESYDNCGLLLGSPDAEISKALLTLDVTEAVVEEAEILGCELIISHHPLIFGGLKSLTGKTAVERTVIKALQAKVAVYAMHTNLDNVMTGVNARLASAIGLQQCRILRPKAETLCKLVVFVPHQSVDAVRQALFDQGAGHIGNYDQCSFISHGQGTFRAGVGSNPAVGEIGKQHREPESRVEIVLPKHLLSNVLQAMNSAHPYEEVAYDVFPLLNSNPEVGAGMIGRLPQPMEPTAWLSHLKTALNLKAIRFNPTPKKQIEIVAVCGGAGSFLLPDALLQGADALVTADFKYHEFFEAESRLMICDVGHWESEIKTTELLRDKLLEKFPTFAPLISKTNTNPVTYFF